MSNKPSTPADYLIKDKGPDGKYKVVGRGWKKTGAYGEFVSLSIGEKGNYKSYLMVKAEDKPKPIAPRSGPPEPRSLADILDDKIPDDPF